MKIGRREKKAPRGISGPRLLIAALAFGLCLSSALNRAQAFPFQDQDTKQPVTMSPEDAADLKATLKSLNDNQERILTQLDQLNARVNELEGNTRTIRSKDAAQGQNPGQAPSGDLAKAQAVYVAHLTQGGSFWQNTGFKFNDDGTASLTGVGTASLNSGESSVNGGSGAQMLVIFTDLQDPLFKKCVPLLQKQFTSPFPVTTELSVFGQGSYEMGAADPGNPGNITRAFAFRLGKLTSCEMGP